MALYDLGGWWVALYIGGTMVLSLLMVEAMMQFTSALLERPPSRRQRNFLPLDTLRADLLALRGPYFAMVPRGPNGLAARWDVLAGEQPPPGLRVKLSATWSTRMLLDPRRREARWYESVRTSSVFVGFSGWRPLMTFGWHYQGGYLSGVWSGNAYLVTDGFPPRVIDARPFDIDTDALREPFVERVTESGWTFRPATLPLYTSPRWLAFTNWIIPEPLTRVPRGRLWGVLYPASFVLLIGFLIAPLDGLGLRDVALIGLVTFAWWGVWGLIAWLLSRPPRKRRRSRRHS